MMITNAGRSLVERVREATIDYEPSITTLEHNKTRALIGSGALVGTYALPGDHELLAGMAIGYLALKSYHALRDWMER